MCENEQERTDKQPKEDRSDYQIMKDQEKADNCRNCKGQSRCRCDRNPPTKMEMLNDWIDELIFPGERKKLIQELEGHNLSGKETFRKFCFYTKDHVYYVKALDRVIDDGYLSCIADCRKSRAGETWTRGNDLPNGNFTRKTWNRIVNAILRYELVNISKYKRPIDASEVGDTNT